jgi:hypothetical protein
VILFSPDGGADQAGIIPGTIGKNETVYGIALQVELAVRKDLNQAGSDRTSLIKHKGCQRNSARLRAGKGEGVHVNSQIKEFLPPLLGHTVHNWEAWHKKILTV